jgi:hypothetical protein
LFPLAWLGWLIESFKWCPSSPLSSSSYCICKAFTDFKRSLLTIVPLLQWPFLIVLSIDGSESDSSLSSFLKLAFFFSSVSFGYGFDLGFISWEKPSTGLIGCLQQTLLPINFNFCLNIYLIISHYIDQFISLSRMMPLEFS